MTAAADGPRGPELLGPQEWLRRVDRVRDPGQDGFWRVVERLARWADFGSGGSIRPSQARLAGGKVSTRTVQRHLALALRVGLVAVQEERPGRPTVYALAWPRGVTPSQLADRLAQGRAAGRTSRCATAGTA